MKDLTQGSIPKHLVSMALPIAVGLIVQTMYFLVDLYFVGQLGGQAIAAVSSAGSLFFFIMALTQVLNIGCSTLVSHAVGRKNKDEANQIFNQSFRLALTATVVLSLCGYLIGKTYFQFLAADDKTTELAVSYFYWFIPSLTLQFVITVYSAALRGTGIVKPVMSRLMIGVILNIVLSPILIAGWGVGIEMGVAGAGLASSLSTLLTLVLLISYFSRKESYLELSFAKYKSDNQIAKKLLKIGLPAGGEFLMTFFYMSIIYWALSSFSANAQAGFGLGVRLMQSLFLPVMAIAFAAPAIAGQNFAAGNSLRVKQTYHYTAVLTCSLMAILMFICLIAPEVFIVGFTSEPEVILVATTFLSFIGLNFVPAGYVMTASGMFQALGNTLPALLSTASRLTLFALPVFYLASRNGFEIEHIWYCSVATVFIQAGISYFLLNREFSKRLPEQNLALNKKALT